MDIIDILDNKVKDKIKEKNELEEIIKGLKIEINEYKNNMDSLKKKNDFYKNELNLVLDDLDQVVKNIDI
jgi:predicted nuclease with TOPRIM domain|tara:strand:- start:1508 stop:1717 length:210 start_codon:yes stop_codon:yes gene_type:complete